MRYGEEKFVVVLGGLHIEMSAFKLLGDWLEDSGWIDVIVQAKVASPGIANSFLKASHLTKTRHAHQVTASSLYILLRRSYESYTMSLMPEESPLTFEEWCCQRSQEIPQFNFWYTTCTLRLELLVLTFIRSLREGNFGLYIDSLTALAPWHFSLDHTNYARWLPVHIRDMSTLNTMHPEIAAEFTEGNFVVRKSRRTFSAIALDQAHEQNNAAVKCEAGAIAGLEINFFTHSQNVASASKIYSLKWNHCSLRLRSKFGPYILILS